ncbi:MAG: amidohydrolase family protein [Candidatus Heimdallarchaeota archaeon]
MNFELIIRHGKIVDGTGNPGYFADIGVNNGQIVKISRNINDKLGKKVINASDMIVCPGFIDMHSHTDVVLPVYSGMDAAVHQGITTAVVGMCGAGLAPVPTDKLEIFKEHFKSPVFGYVPIKWSSYSDYLSEMDKLRIPANLVFVVGFETIRIAGGPGFENRAPSENEFEEMKKYATEAMEAGAFGMSTGLIYAPQIFAKTEEIIDVAKVVGKYNGLYFSHIRDEANNLLSAVKEFIEIVEKSNCRGGQIAHFKVAGKNNWGASKDSLRLVEEANEKGISITFDQYPYNRGQTSLVTALPPWAREGDLETIHKRLKDPEYRERLKEDLLNISDDWENWIIIDGFDALYPTFFKNKEWKDLEGKNIEEITKIMAYKDNWEAFFDILIKEDCETPITIESMGEEDIRRIMTHRYQMFGTDSIAAKLLPELKVNHPRTFGTFPRVLGKYVREEKLLTIENAIRKMTSFPAQRLGLRDRSLIREGNWADIVIFNPETIKDNTTYEEPHQFPEGIRYVLVNGVIVIENSKQLRKYPGKVLRRPS